MQPDGYSPLHQHPEQHRLFITGGKGTVSDGQKTIPIQTGDIVYIEANEPHQLKTIGNRTPKIHLPNNGHPRISRLFLPSISALTNICHLLQLLLGSRGIYPLKYDVIIVGAGPAGIFSALELTEKSNLNVLVIDRGADIEKRKCPSTTWL